MQNLNVFFFGESNHGFSVSYTSDSGALVNAAFEEDRGFVFGVKGKGKKATAILRKKISLEELAGDVDYAATVDFIVRASEDENNRSYFVVNGIDLQDDSAKVRVNLVDAEGLSLCAPYNNVFASYPIYTGLNFNNETSPDRHLRQVEEAYIEIEISVVSKTSNKAVVEFRELALAVEYDWN